MAITSFTLAAASFIGDVLFPPGLDKRRLAFLFLDHP